MEERSLVRLIALWPKIVEAAAVKREPHRIAFYLNDLASCFHTLQHKGKINPEFRFIRVGQSDLSFARLSLVRATKEYNFKRFIASWNKPSSSDVMLKRVLCMTTGIYYIFTFSRKIGN